MRTVALGAGLLLSLSFGFTAAHAQNDAQATAERNNTATRLRPITVSAPAAALTSSGIEADHEEIRLTPGGVTLVEGAASRASHVSDMEDMLRYAPGLSLTGASLGKGTLSSRGSNLDSRQWENNGILLLQNGIPISSADGTNTNGISNPLSSLYAIVARGANAMKYGASTLGGAINFISPTAYDVPGLMLYINGGGHGQIQGRVTASRVFSESLDGLLTLFSSRRDGFREHTQKDQTGIFANVGWRISPSLATRLYVTYSEQDIKIGGSISRDQLHDDYDQAAADAVKGDFQHNSELWRVASKTTLSLGPNRRLDIGFAYEEQQLYHPIVADRSRRDSPFFDGLVVDNKEETISASIRYEHRIGAHGLLFGAYYLAGNGEGKNFGNNSGERGDLQSLSEGEAETLTVYVMDRWHIGDHWTLVPGLQYVHASRDTSNTSITNPDVPFAPPRSTTQTHGDFSSVNPRLGVIYEVEPGFELFANVSRIFEPPTNIALEDPSTANKDDVLDAMEGTVVEFGTRGHQTFGSASSWHWELSAYYTWLDNEILTVKNPHPTSRRDLFVTSNADDTIHAGIEALVSAHFALGNSGVHAIQPTMSLTLNRFRFDDDPDWGDNALAGAPDYVLKGQVLYRNANGFYIGPTFDFVGERFADLANSYTVDPYALVGLLAGWSNDQWSVSLEVENLFDTEYVAQTDIVADAKPSSAILEPGAPISLYMGVEWQIQ